MILCRTSTLSIILFLFNYFDHYFFSALFSFDYLKNEADDVFNINALWTMPFSLLKRLVSLYHFTTILYEFIFIYNGLNLICQKKNPIFIKFNSTLLVSIF